MVEWISWIRSALRMLFFESIGLFFVYGTTHGFPLSTSPEFRPAAHLHAPPSTVKTNFKDINARQTNWLTYDQKWNWQIGRLSNSIAWYDGFRGTRPNPYLYGGLGVHLLTKAAWKCTEAWIPLTHQSTADGRIKKGDYFSAFGFHNYELFQWNSYCEMTLLCAWQIRRTC